MSLCVTATHLVVVKSHLFGKQMGFPHKFRYGQSLLVLWCDTDFNAEELIPASCAVIADHLHFFVGSLRPSAAKIMQGKPTTELALSENMVQIRASVRYCLTLSHHSL